MGHLSRQVAIAAAGSPRMRGSILSMSGAVPVVAATGVPAEFCPGPDRRWVNSREWHGYLRDRIVALVEELSAEAVVFDGVAPYPGIGRARPELPGVKFVWMRRGMWIPGVNDQALSRSGYFDQIIEPGDLAGEVDVGPTVDLGDAVRIAPVSMLEVEPPLERSAAAAALGIDPDRPTLLATLGTGRLGDVVGPGRVVLETALADPRWQICLTKPAIAGEALPNPDPTRVVELHDVYPLVRYLGAFDAAVSGCGYNAFHEFLPAAVPTLFVPSPKSVTDDQQARASWGERQGLSLMATAGQLEQVEEQTRRLLDDGVRRDLAEACRSIGTPAGASEAVEVILDRSGGLSPERRRPGPDDPGVGPFIRWQAQRLIGPTATATVRWMLRRQGERPELERTEFGASSEAAFGTEISLDLLRSGVVVEHLLAGTSSRYRAARRSIIGRYYEADPRWVALER